MMSEEKKPAPSNLRRKIAMQLLSGAVFGVVTILAFKQFAPLDLIGAQGRSEKIALVIAMLYGVMGTFVVLGMAAPWAGAKVLNFEDEAELRDQRRLMAWSAGTMVVMGALLAMLAFAGPSGPVPPATALIITGVSAVALTWASLQIMRNLDELMRSVTRETGEMSYYLIFLVGGGWAVLGHLGYVPPMGMLDFLSLTYSLGLVASYIATGRRGMLKLR
jgi:hypothetical protein